MYDVGKEFEWKEGREGRKEWRLNGASKKEMEFKEGKNGMMT